MSFSDLVSGGPSCGPSNPLQNLGKRFGQDRSSQMDRFDGDPGGEAAMRASFREQHGRNAHGNVNEPAFFQQPAHSAFDLQPLQGALPHVQANRSSPFPADLHGAWQQRQGQPSQREHFERSFRHATSAGGSTASADPRWAREYAPGVMSNGAASPQLVDQRQQHGTAAMMQGGGPGAMMYRSRINGMGSNYLHTPDVSMMSNTYNGVHQQNLIGESTQWDSAFSEMEQRSKSASPSMMDSQPIILPATEQNQKPIDPKDADELARTAGRLVSTVEHDQSNKFKQSNFLNLMRKIRDRQAGIQGTDIVESDSAALGDVTDKGKGRALDPATTSSTTATTSATSHAPVNQMDAMRQRGGMAPARTAMPIDMTEEMLGRQELNDIWAEEDARSEAIEQEAMKRMAFVGDGGDVDRLRAEDEAEFNKYQNLLGAHLGPAAAGLKNAQRNLSAMEEVFDDELEGADFVGKRWQGSQGRGVPGMQSGEWDKLQADWDTWQAGSAGLEQSREAPLSAATAPSYHFHAYNPYVGATNNPAREINAASLPPDMQSVLEREAEVQRDPNNAAAWLELGVKQQENEREGLAIAALHRAIQLDPTIRDAWLALAVSYTNETDRSAALEAIERWVDATPEYRAIVREHRQANGDDAGKSKASQLPVERHEQVTKLLIALARHSSTEGKIDADIQVALGVLFNASEDYDKAVDCFTTALQVRPDDWLMYNRLGATLSNSGRSAEALRYYQHALDLKPGFVRCHFNMSISCLNLQMYRQAALHIYTALTLQSESVDLSQDAVAREQSNLLGSGVNGVTSSSLWETLRVACELMDRPDLANYAVQRDLDRFDPSEFFSPNEDGDAMEPTV